MSALSKATFQQLSSIYRPQKIKILKQKGRCDKMQRKLIFMPRCKTQLKLSAEQEITKLVDRSPRLHLLQFSVALVSLPLFGRHHLLTCCFLHAVSLTRVLASPLLL